MNQSGARWLVSLGALSLLAILILIAGFGRGTQRQVPLSADTNSASAIATEPISDVYIAPSKAPIAELPRVDEPAVIDSAAESLPIAAVDLTAEYVSKTNDQPIVTASLPVPAATDALGGVVEHRVNGPVGAALPPDQATAFAVAPPHDAQVETAPLAGHTQPTPELIAIARQADSHNAHGALLAERGAIFSARAQFIQALRLSAAVLDAQRNTTAHSQALARGFRALDETKDLAFAATATVDDLHPSQALQRCLAYAQEQLAAGAGDLQPAASALFALGKLEMTAALTRIGSPEAARAAVFLQAALVVNPRHALAANELGVLLARHGRIDEAKAALQYSARIAPQPAVWRNLAIVHHGMGELDLAARADWEYQKATSAAHNRINDASSPMVRWVDPATFAASGRFNGQAPAVAALGAYQSTAASKNAENSTSAAARPPWSPTKR
jgi:tetratricopeptide (TPR) repeat protein